MRLRRSTSRLTRTIENSVAAMPASATSAAADGHDAPILQTNTAAEEQNRRVVGCETEAAAAASTTAAAATTTNTATKATAAASAKSEDILPLEKEFAFLRKEQAEARQVDLLLVVFDLREIGVVSDVGDELLCDAPLDVDAGVDIERVVDDRRGFAIGDRGRERVRLDVEVAKIGRSLELDKRSGKRRHHEPAPPVGGRDR